MSVSRETIDRLLAMSAQPSRCGEWKEFCEREGVGYETLRYWRRKLSLRLRKKVIVKPVMNSYSDIATV